MKAAETFLQWQHKEKTDRFETLISFLVDVEIGSDRRFWKKR